MTDKQLLQDAARAGDSPAFPTYHQSSLNGHPIPEMAGMTMRDYFAAKALCGIEASQGNNGAFICTVEKVAERAYELANAMLRARAAAAIGSQK